jgi:hypothetical protein
MKFRMSAAAVLAGLAGSAAAVPVIDQSQPGIAEAISSLGQLLAQSFTAGATNVSGAGFYISNASPGATANITIQLWSALPNAPGASMLTSGNVTASNGNWADVSFTTPVATTVGQSLVLLVTGGTGPLAIMGSTGNPYGSGQVYVGPGYANLYPTYDYAFRTYTNVSAVPEPATALMLALGVAVLGVTARRRG